MNFPLKSVIMMIGPSGCGKSHFIREKLVPALKAATPNANIQVLSSDDYRRELLGKNLDKANDLMNYASEGAFKLMEAKFRAVTTWPVSADYIILDATFIGEKSREQFVELTKKANYSLVGVCFDYADRDEYFKYTDPKHSWLVGNHLKRFKQETLGEIRRKDFDFFHKVKSKDAELVLDRDATYDTMAKSILPPFGRYFIIGDVHACLDELKALLLNAGFTIEDGLIKGNDDTLIVFVGDLADKGPQINDLIEFIYANRARIRTVVGNHDHALIRFISNNVNDKAADEKRAKFFDSFGQMTESAKSKFMEIMNNSSYFLLHDHFVVTHAPCANNRIGKMDPRSLKDQGNCSYGWRREYDSDEAFIEGIKKSIHYVFDEAKKYDPYHFFGHIAVAEATTIGNKVFLDTGCAYGNRLTGVFFNAHNRTISFKWVTSNVPKGAAEGDIANFKIVKKQDLFQSLDFDDKLDVVKFARNKINFISGTMSPCDKNVKEGTLEDMREAFEYFKGAKVEKVILQKKYMGSRANMYLFPHDIEDSYMVSRNGFVIKHLDLAPLYKKMREFFRERSKDIYNSKLIIIDGELMPWSALGKGLIDSHFKTTGIGLSTEANLLEQTGFEIALAKMQDKFDASGFKGLKNSQKKKDLMDSMGEANYRLMSAFDGFKWLSLAEQKAAIALYNKQMDIYGKEGDLEFKPFALLKTVAFDGAEKTFFEADDTLKTQVIGSYGNQEYVFETSNQYVFAVVSDDEYKVCNTDEAGLAEAKEWFAEQVKNNIEGVVVKPANKVYIPGVAPYMKVRNPNYLTIIYGYDYQIEPKFSKMLEDKSIRNKLRTSIKEFEIGKAMLEIPYASISENNVKYLDLCAEMVVEEKREKSFDPRL
jgi:predicted kinase